MDKIILFTPPFVQLSSPYPATPFLKGFLQTKGVFALQYDLSLMVFLKLFSSQGLSILFNEVENSNCDKNEYITDFISKKEFYIDTIDQVILFLQGKYPQLYRKILSRGYLPEGNRFLLLKESRIKPKETEDYAVYLASLYIDDITDFAKMTVLPHFGLSSYMENAASPGISFDKIESLLSADENIITKILYEILDEIPLEQYDIAGITIPFPGNLYMALKMCSYIKKRVPKINIIAGGGYVNTDLRLLKDPGIFKYIDFISYDDGEEPILSIINYCNGTGSTEKLVRTRLLENGEVKYYDNGNKICHLNIEPDYEGLTLDKYITLRESINKMHTLWSERVYLKLRMAHGCYHHRCTFCDTDLDYIKNYQPDEPEKLIETVKNIIKKTGVRSFHFIDEGLPPAVLRNFLLLLLKEKIDITWWGNVRFDQSFTPGLCRLMRQTGCIAVTGGIESANDRILKLMDKKTTTAGIIKVCNNFAKAGIMVHGYLIYGFPTETIDEALSSLEIIRQMYLNKIIDSGFYHRFSLTIHSPIFRDPDRYNINVPTVKYSDFSNNDVFYAELQKTGIDKIGAGINKAIYNFNYRNCLDEPVKSWFPGIKAVVNIPAEYVKGVIKGDYFDKCNSKPLWIGSTITLTDCTSGSVILTFSGKKDAFSYELPEELGRWFYEFLCSVSVENWLKQEVKTINYWFSKAPVSYFNNIDELFENEMWKDLEAAGLLLM